MMRKILTLICFSMCLTAPPLSLAASTSAASGVSYYDDFSGDLSRWTADANGGTWAIQGGNLIGNYDISCGSNSCAQSDLILNDAYQPSGDWLASVDFNRIQYVGYSQYNVSAVAFSLWKNANNKINIAADISSTGSVNFSAANWNGQWSTIKQASYAKGFDPALPHTATLVKTGANYKFYIDGTYIDEINDTFLNGIGKIGLHTYGTKKLGNFRIQLGNVSYYDDFSGDLSRWTADANGGTWAIQSGYLIGNYDISCGSNGCAQSDLILNDAYQPSGDWLASVDFNRIQYVGYSQYNVSAVAFSLWKNANNKINIAADISSTGSVNFSAANWNGQWSTIKQASYAKGFDPALPHTAILVKTGANYKFYIDGTYIDEINDTFLSGTGKIGLHTYGTKKLDNFRIQLSGSSSSATALTGSQYWQIDYVSPYGSLDFTVTGNTIAGTAYADRIAGGNAITGTMTGSHIEFSRSGGSGQYWSGDVDSAGSRITGTFSWTTGTPGSQAWTATKVSSSIAATNGSCGSSNGTSASSAPATNLCAIGTASSVSGSGPWTWSCSGNNGGGSASCSANRSTTLTGTQYWQIDYATPYGSLDFTVTGGTISGTVYANQIVGGNAISGTIVGSHIEFSRNSAAGQYWTGDVSSSGTTISGTFTSTTGIPPTAWTATKVASSIATANGTCGSSNGTNVSSAPATNLCSVGTASSVSGSGPWTWSCGGSNGGSSASCSANVSSTLTSLNASCPTTVNSGASGTCSATASYSGGFSKSVTPTWTVSGGAASINANGTLTASASTSGTVTVTASYTESGVTKTATATVTISATTALPIVSTTTTQADCVFKWAEGLAPELFSPGGAISKSFGNYYYRYYANTNSYLAMSVSDAHLVYIGFMSGNSLLDLGAMSGWLATAGCH